MYWHFIDPKAAKKTITEEDMEKVMGLSLDYSDAHVDENGDYQYTIRISGEENIVKNYAKKLLKSKNFKLK